MQLKQSTLLSVVILALLIIALAGCGSQAISTLRPATSGTGQTGQTGQLNTGQTDTSQIDRASPPILLSNPLPGQLEAYVIVTMGGYDLISRTTTTIAVSFSNNGRIVQFTGQERLRCNGQDVSIHGIDATFQVAQAPTNTLAGRTYSCTYSVKETTATLKFTVPTAPIISSPGDDARVTRSASTPITYEARDGSLMGIVALGANTKAVARLDSPGTGQATVDTHAFPAGPGSLSLTQTLNFKVSEEGTPFHSIGSGGTAMTMVPVTWV